MSRIDRTRADYLLLAASYLVPSAVYVLPLAGEMSGRARRISDAGDRRRSELALLAAERLVERATHSFWRDIHVACDAADRTQLPGEATSRLRLLEVRLRASLDRQRDLRGRLGVSAVVPTADRSPVGSFQDPLVSRYGGGDWVPDRVPDWLGTALGQTGMVLDEVRQLHSARIEHAVLQLTFASRLGLLAAAPLLTGRSAGRRPLQGGPSLRDVPWAAALGAAAATTLRAGELASLMMERSDRSARLRRTLGRIEAPIALAACTATPGWPVAVFATGWTNYLQRPVFDWRKLAGFLAVVGTAQQLGLRQDGVGLPRAAAETLATFAAIGITGGSYGAMLLVSASTMAEAVQRGYWTRYQALRRARGDLGLVSASLEDIARALASATDESEREAARRARSAAAQAREAIAVLERPGGVAPSGLRALLGSAMRQSRLPDAMDATEPASGVTARLLRPIFDPMGLEAYRVRRRRHRRALHQAIVLLLEEAADHGTRLVSCQLLLVDGELRVVVANEVADDDRPGRGSGRHKLAEQVGRLPGGRVVAGGLVDGDEVGRPGLVLWRAGLACSREALAVA